MRVHTLVLQTFGRLAGVRAFLEVLDRALPESEWAHNEALKERAEQQDWEFAEFDVERQILDERFQFWLPRFTTYSVVTLLYTVLETQLAACAKLACSEKQASFQPNDVPHTSASIPRLRGRCFPRRNAGCSRIALRRW